MPEETVDEGFRQVARSGDFGVGGGAIEGYGFVDIVGVDYAENGDVGGLPLFMGAFSGLWTGVTGRGLLTLCKISVARPVGPKTSFRMVCAESMTDVRMPWRFGRRFAKES